MKNICFVAFFLVLAFCLSGCGIGVYVHPPVKTPTHDTQTVYRSNELMERKSQYEREEEALGIKREHESGIVLWKSETPQKKRDLLCKEVLADIYVIKYTIGKQRFMVPQALIEVENEFKNFSGSRDELLNTFVKFVQILDGLKEKGYLTTSKAEYSNFWRLRLQTEFHDDVAFSLQKGTAPSKKAPEENISRRMITLTKALTDLQEIKRLISQQKFVIPDIVNQTETRMKDFDFIESDRKDFVQVVADFYYILSGLYTQKYFGANQSYFKSHFLDTWESKLQEIRLDNGVNY